MEKMKIIGYHGTSVETWRIARNTGFMPGDTRTSFESSRGELFFYPRLKNFPTNLRNYWEDELDIVPDDELLSQAKKWLNKSHKDIEFYHH